MKLKNFLTVIQNSVGSRLFCSYFNQKGEDVLENGNLSCAFYVSSILHIFQMIDRPHFTVRGTIFEMENNGWYKINKPKAGCVVVWDPIKIDDIMRYHIGFYIGEGQAISNRSSVQAIGAHPLHYSGLDKDNLKKNATIHSLYWHKELS